LNSPLLQFVPLCVGGIVAVFTGLDRTALLQVLISRPLVAGPLVGWLLGVPENGLLIGALTELLWLGRLPVGAAIPPDDTQVAVAATTLTVLLGGGQEYAAEPLSMFCLLLSMPPAKVGQLFDRWARERNGRLQKRAEEAIEAGCDQVLERLHLTGLLHFGIASLATYLIIVVFGGLAGEFLLPLTMPALDPVSSRIEFVFPVVGAAVILVTMNVSRAWTLFSASFLTVFLVLWLI
jgi:PTS system mannose-specific IIC component